MIEVQIPSEFVALCSDWAGDTSCMLRAIDSAGSLTLGTIRPYSTDAGRHLTDEEWQVSLFDSLASDVRYTARMAEQGQYEDADALRRFETFADETAAKLRTAYGLQDSEVV